MKPYRVQRNTKQAILYIHLYGFIPLLQQKHHIYITLITTKFYGQGKNTVSCARQGLKHLRSYSPQEHCNGCTGQQRMMTAGKSATSHCLATFLARMALADGTAKGFHRPLMLSVGQAPGIPRNCFQRNGIWAGSASAACWTSWKGWNS